jgi:succinyl-CoA synthetase beta subunit
MRVLFKTVHGIRTDLLQYKIPVPRSNVAETAEQVEEIVKQLGK